jgi:hypothetical protein
MTTAEALVLYSDAVEDVVKLHRKRVRLLRRMDALEFTIAAAERKRARLETLVRKATS